LKAPSLSDISQVLVKQSAIWVYNNGVFLSEESFHSLASAIVAIGYSKTSIAARQSIDTGKVIRGQYTFYSKPL